MSNELFCGWSTGKLIRKYRRVKFLTPVKQVRYNPTRQFQKIKPALSVAEGTESIPHGTADGTH